MPVVRHPHHRGLATPLVVVTMLLTALVAPSAPADAGPRKAAPRPSESIRVDMGAPRHGPIAGWGVDLKQKCGWNETGCRSRATRYATEPDLVERTFGDGRFDWVRITFRADKRGFTLEDDGTRTLNRDWYQPTIDAVKAIRAVDPTVQVWASRDTVTDCDPVERPPGRGASSCPDYDPSLKEGGVASGTLIPERYGAHAAAYVNFLRAEGVPIHVLGLDNEPHNNEGDLTPPRLLQTVEALETGLTGPLPMLMMNCANNPDTGWLRRAPREVLDKLTYASMHSHPKRLSKLRAKGPGFANLARAKGLIPVNTELHWHHRAPRPIDRVTLSVQATLDQLTWGYRAFAKWTYRPDHASTPSPHRTEAQVTNALAVTTTGSRWVRTTDWDGRSLDRGVKTQAFRRGSQIHLWIVNDTSRNHPGRALDVRGARGARRTPRTVTLQRWSARGDQVVRTLGRGTRRQGVVRVNIPAQSVMMVRIRL